MVSLVRLENMDLLGIIRCLHVENVTQHNLFALYYLPLPLMVRIYFSDLNCQSVAVGPEEHVACKTGLSYDDA